MKFGQSLRRQISHDRPVARVHGAQPPCDGVKEARLQGGSVSSHGGPLRETRRAHGDEFETCPSWAPSMDTRQQLAQINLKTILFQWLDPWANRAARVRNVSKGGRRKAHAGQMVNRVNGALVR